MSDRITIHLTLPRSLSLHRLCQSLHVIGLFMSYDWNDHYQLSEVQE